MIRISICHVIFELWPKICQSESFRHFPRPRKKHENEAKMKVAMIIGISTIYQHFFTCLASLVRSISSNTARSLPVSPYLKEVNPRWSFDYRRSIFKVSYSQNVLNIMVIQCIYILKSSWRRTFVSTLFTTLLWNHRYYRDPIVHVIYSANTLW